MSQQETHYLQETAANKLSYSARRPRNRPQRFNDVMVLMKLMSDNDDKQEQRCNNAEEQDVSHKEAGLNKIMM